MQESLSITKTFGAMKKICFILGCFILPFLASCQQEYIQQDNLYSVEYDLRPGDWTAMDTYYSATLDVKEITKSVCRNGTVQCFLIYEDGSQSCLPMTRYLSYEYVNEETGEVKTKKVKTDVLEPGVEPLDYTINFCKEAIHILDRDNIPESLRHIEMVERSLNSVLLAQKYLTLNQARVSLGVPEIWFGQIVGWTLDGTGDDEIQLRPRVVYDEETETRTIILDPNVDGPMFHKIGGMING